MNFLFDGCLDRSNTEPMSEDRHAFVAAMAQAATGVTIVATDGPGGRVGLTVSAVCSVSADPPTVLACVRHRSPLSAAIVANGVFAISVLGAAQAHVADTFAGRTPPGGRYDFGCARWTAAPSGAPLLNGAVATFDCALQAVHDGSSHAIVLGTVTHSVRAGGEPLVYTDHTYGRPRPLVA